MFEFIKFMYSINGYDNKGVAYFVGIGNIDADQYKTITGQDYNKEG
ncbi:XkdX family protein [Companilactobacillus nuruki]|uniref:XkdX family protein n=1 Tax=Companilactobacillus nuruki TaxID=1993540 RepID=A0A2N7AV62_9LACO|nr:XkdX family protein [Companilactobacillus nuruki]PMD71514.1 XkdX family protein [Companilactobacillus nuruki]